MLLTRLYLQLGIALDYYTGLHDPSLSASLCNTFNETDVSKTENNQGTLKNQLSALIPPDSRILFPQFGVTPSWPPTMLFHGSVDTAVPIEESRHLHALLQEAGVVSQLVILENQEHSFEYIPEAEALFAAHFDAAADFLSQYL